MVRDRCVRYAAAVAVAAKNKSRIERKLQQRPVGRRHLSVMLRARYSQISRVTRAPSAEPVKHFRLRGTEDLHSLAPVLAQDDASCKGAVLFITFPAS
jgi:hypothetical protein